MCSIGRQLIQLGGENRAKSDMMPMYNTIKALFASMKSTHAPFCQIRDDMVPAASKNMGTL